MPSATLVSTKIDLLYREMENAHWFADYLAQPGLDLNESEFATIVKQAIDMYGVDVEVICERFNVARTTVTRWKGGKNAPQSFARPVVVAFIETQARAHAESLKTELEVA